MKPFAAFHGDGTKKDGIASRCASCLSAPKKRRYITSRYGISEAEYDSLLASPCLICGHEAEALDHCHASGRVRGQLCGACNRGLGQFKDRPDLLRAAAGYLELHLAVA